MDHTKCCKDRSRVYESAWAIHYECPTHKSQIQIKPLKPKPIAITNVIAHHLIWRNKIKAIKEIRAEYNYGLKNAKHVYEGWEVNPTLSLVDARMLGSLLPLGINIKR